MYIHITDIVYWIAALGSEAAIIILLVRAFARNLSARAVLVAASVLVAWWAVALIAGISGVFNSAPPGLIGLGVGGPLVLAAVAFAAWKPLREAVAAVPIADLVSVQGFRLLGFMFLLRMVAGVLPPLFALPAGIGDMLTGAAAIPLALALRRNPAGAQRSAVIWNLFGILDLVVAVSIGFFASTTPLQLFHVTPTTDALTLMPTLMVPAFGVPLFLILHAVTLAPLRSTARRSSSGRIGSAAAVSP